jgi:putative membrane protein
LAFIVLQIVVAGVILPAALSPAWYQTLSSILPLSSAIKGMQVLVTGGDLAAAAGAAVFLSIIAAIGWALTLVAISRRQALKSTALGRRIVRVWLRD